MRVLALTLGLLLLVTASAAAQQSTTSRPGEPLFVLSGRGYGHGVGMSQYGAFGMAKAGYTYDKILAHYYPGTTLARVASKEVRVLLAEGKRAVAIASTVPFSVVDGAGERFALPAGPLVLGPQLVIPGANGGEKVKATPPLVVRPGKGDAPLSLDGRPYRGKLELAREGRFLRVVNYVALEGYLRGVVAGEVPYTWPAEALKAQAVTARSYALATLVKGKPFDLYADVRSQVYLGVAGERATTTAAVGATSGRVLTYGGRVATTYYSSTSGGRTASAADVFGFDVPYLVSRPDPWDRASPHHRWGPVVVGARTLQSKLEIEGPVLDATGVVTPSGRLRSLVVHTPKGSTTLSAAVLRTGLGLRSTWVTIGVLRLDQPRAPVVYGRGIRLGGIARALPSPALSSSPDGRAWTRVADVARATNGSAALVVKPERTLRYRIEVKDAASPAVLVRVAPQVQLAATVEPGVLEGSTRPRLQGAQVTIERRNGTSWVRVVETTVNGSGIFRVEVRSAGGTYRARVAPTAGFAEGVGPAVSLTP